MVLEVEKVEVLLKVLDVLVTVKLLLLVPDEQNTSRRHGHVASDMFFWSGAENLTMVPIDSVR